MPSNYQLINDLYFTEDGDYVLSASGDLEDTKNHNYRGFIQKILTRVMSTKGEWRLQRNLGANASKVLGKKNTPEQAERLRSAIHAELIRDSFINSKDIKVIVFPSGPESLVVIIEIEASNSQRKFTLNFTYDFRDNRIVPRNV